MVAHGVPMTDSSDDSADTVISVLDSRLLSQSLSNSDSLLSKDVPQTLESPDSEKQTETDVMGNRQGGEKKKKKDDVPHEKKDEDKPKKRGKRSKGKSKRNSQNVESDVGGQGACASPSRSTVKEKSRSKSKRPDVLADLGKHAPGSPLGSPESASGSQGTWSYDEESDVSTLGYSTPLLSTPQVQRYVLPKQTTHQQSSTERLEELGRSIERTIMDKLSDKPQSGGAAAAAVGPSAPVQGSDRKERRNVKKKRALGQAVIDSDSFTLPLQDVKTGQTSSPSPTTKRLNVGTDKISLRASQESPVSPWLRDDDTPVDEEQMDEMFISCIDLSYNLADICSEKEFTEYGSLDSKKQARSAKERPKDTSLSPRIARKPIVPIPPLGPLLAELESVDSRVTPPKSDSSTSTLAEIGRDSVADVVNLDMSDPNISQAAAQGESKDKVSKVPPKETPCINDDGKEHHVKKKPGKSKTKGKTKKKSAKSSDASTVSMESDIPKDTQTNGSKELNGVVSATVVHSKSNVCDKGAQERGDIDVDVKETISDYENEPATFKVNDQQSTTVLDPFTIQESMTFENSALTSGDNSVTEVKDLCGQSCDIQNMQEIQELENVVDKPTDKISDTCAGTKGSESKTTDDKMTDETNTCQKEESAELPESNISDKIPTMSESLSPKEPASPKHVPPPSPSAMDALAEIDEDDEEAMEENFQLKEVQLFGETVFKRLSSLVESQSQDEDIEERFKDFQDSGEVQGDTDSPPVDLGSMALLNDATVEDDACKEEDSASKGEDRVSEGEDTASKREDHVSKGEDSVSKGEDSVHKETDSPMEVSEEAIVPGSITVVERSFVNIESNGGTLELSMKENVKECDLKDDKEEDADEGTLKRKKKKSSQKRNKKKKDPQSHVVKRPEIPAELKQVETVEGIVICQSEETNKGKSKTDDESEKENTPPKRESQQIEEVIDAYGIGDLNIDKPVGSLRYEDERPRYESDDSDDEDTDSSFNSKSRSSGHPSSSSMELTSRCIPDIEETFSELLSVKHILEDLEDRTPTEEVLPSFVGYDELRSPPEFVNGRRSRMSPAVTDRTESDLDISEQRDDISTDSMYADDEDDGASEVLFSRSYSEPAGNEVVVSCTFYNTQHNNNNIDDSDDFWEDYSTADESFKQIEISADAASSTFQNARKQMHDIHQHLQDLRRQMEHLREEVESATLTPEYSMDSEDKRPITE